MSLVRNHRIAGWVEFNCSNPDCDRPRHTQVLDAVVSYQDLVRPAVSVGVVHGEITEPVPAIDLARIYLDAVADESLDLRVLEIACYETDDEVTL